jgi:hypothetical protein
MHKHACIQYHMPVAVSTYIHLHPLLIHQLDNPCIVNHSSMHIKQPQILLASAMHKTCLHTLSHTIHSLNSYSLTHYTHSSIGQPMHSQSFMDAYQTVPNTVSICNEQTCIHTLSHAFHSLNSYSLTNYTHSSIGQHMHSQ